MKYNVQVVNKKTDVVVNEYPNHPIEIAEFLKEEYEQNMRILSWIRSILKEE